MQNYKPEELYESGRVVVGLTKPRFEWLLKQEQAKKLSRPALVELVQKTFGCPPNSAEKFVKKYERRKQKHGFMTSSDRQRRRKNKKRKVIR